MNLLGFVGGFLNEQNEISSKNKEKIQEAKDKYWNAVNLPRKTKKKVRKEAKIDCSFWVNMDNWHSNMFNF